MILIIALISPWMLFAQDLKPLSLSGGSIATSTVAETALRQGLKGLKCASLLGYGAAMGDAPLQKLLANLHQQPDHAPNILITSSAQAALNIIFAEMIKTERKIFVQQPAFFGALRLLKGHSVVTFTTVKELLPMLQRERGALVYLTSNFQSPAGRSLSTDQKTRIALALKMSDSFAIEDNPYDALAYDGHIPSTVFSIVSERVFLVGGLSKLLGPGLRVGYAFIPERFLTSIRSAKIDADLFTSTLTQKVAARVLSRRSYLSRLRAEFSHKRDLALAELNATFGQSGVTWSEPNGGIFLELQIPPDVSLPRLIESAMTKYNLKLEDDRFTYRDGTTRGALRINFVQNTPDDLREAVQRLGRAYRDVKRSVIVTSGGTTVFIDDVRTISNSSRGTTGAKIAEEFLRRGYLVYFVTARDSRQPFDEFFKVDPALDLASELSRIEKGSAEVSELKSRLVTRPYVTFEEYMRAVEDLVKSKNADAIVLAAAVSDYGRTAAAGKLTSESARLDFSLERLPKVIAQIKKWNPKIFQVGFKLLSRVSLSEATDTAYRSGIQNHSNLTLLNIVQGHDFGDRQNLLITPEKGLLPMATVDVPRRLVEMVEQRSSKQHYQTEAQRDGAFLQAHRPRIEEFKRHVAEFWKLNVFEPYTAGATAYFGFYALRAPGGGFFITARESDKRDIQDDDIVYVSSVDFERRIVHATSTGKKASLNANVAAAIFAERPDVDVVMHAHIFPGLMNKTRTDYAPSTQEDLDETLKYLRHGETSVELVNHGVILLGRTLEDLTKQLDVQSAYFKFPKMYDLIYQRFQRSTEFIDLVKSETTPSQALLDLAAGTGEVSAALLGAGYENLTLADQSLEMLAVAMDKIGTQLKSYQANFETLRLPERYDAVVIRQAVNYAKTPTQLRLLFENVRAQLQPGGKFIFNAPNFKGERTFPDRVHTYEAEGFAVEVAERNTIDADNVLTHAQRARLIRTDGREIKKLYDLNRFRMYTAEEFERILRAAGFSRIRITGESGRSLYVVAEI